MVFWRRVTIGSIGTYHNHHIQKLGMKQSTYDPCLLYTTEGFGLAGLQTDDTIFLADEEFATREETELQRAKLLAKPREKLAQDCPIRPCLAAELLK